MKNLPRALSLAVLAPLALLASAERCGPATGLYPAYTKGAVVVDDALIGSFELAEKAGAAKKGTAKTTAKIVKDDTVDGASYLLTLSGGEPDPTLTDVRFRLFVFDVGGGRFGDLVAEGTGKTGGFARDLSVPQHMYFKVTHTAGDGVGLDYLDAKWMDAEIARDPKAASVITLPFRYKKQSDGTLGVDNGPILSGDAAAIQKILERAAPVDDAWTMGLELVRTGHPRLSFTITNGVAESSKDSSSSDDTITVIGTRISFESAYSGRNAGMPGHTPRKASGRVKDVARLEGLVRAFTKSAVAKPAKPIPKPIVDVTVRTACVTVDAGAPRCLSRLAGDDSGADLAAFDALMKAVLEDVKLP